MLSKEDWVAPFPEPLSGCSPAGYAWLTRKYRLTVLPHHRWTFVADRHTHRIVERKGTTVYTLPAARWPGDSDLEHLLFALRTDGVSLPIWRALLNAVDVEELGQDIAEEVRLTPTGAYARRAWFLYETLTGRALVLPDTRQGNYVALLDPTVHVTGPVQKCRRHRINVNTLGPLSFAPIVRWTASLREVSAPDVSARIDRVITGYDDHTFRRAISYLYTRETMATFEIERERPARTRAETFIALLRDAPHLDVLTPEALVSLQNAIVDPRFADAGWRDEQNYVGEVLDYTRQRIHFVCPRPDDLPELMGSYLDMVERLMGSESLDPVLASAIISFSFVLLHPFTDGNGRLHRWLIHWVLSRSGVVPGDLIIPVSAVMLSERRAYDEALESYSEPLTAAVPYELSPDGRMTVDGDTADLYRHPDITRMVEGLWTWLQVAIDKDLPEQLGFLRGLDRSRLGIQEVVDMPDRLIVLFIKVCLANEGRLSRRKRERHFDMLTDGEIEQMEAVVEQHFELASKASAHALE